MTQLRNSITERKSLLDTVNVYMLDEVELQLYYQGLLGQLMKTRSVQFQSD